MEQDEIWSRQGKVINKMAERIMKKNPGMPKIMSEQEYLNRKGVGSSLSGVMDDRLRSVRQLRSTRGEDKFHRENKKAIDSYQAKRNQSKREYQRLVSSGKVRPPSNAEKA